MFVDRRDAHRRNSLPCFFANCVLADNSSAYPNSKEQSVAVAQGAIDSN